MTRTMTRMSTTRLSTRKRARSGQFIIIYIMGLFSMFILAFATIAVGQVVVRKQWAQLIADAGAYTGAAVEAKGLNTISRVEHFNFLFFKWTQFFDRQVGVEVGGLVDMIQALAGSGPRDDVWDRHDGAIKAVFTASNGIVTLINNDPTGITEGSRSSAFKKAEAVTQENFRRFFPTEDTSDTNKFKMPSMIPGYLIPLADLTPYFDETVGWWYHNLDGASDLCYWGACVGRDILSPLSFMFLDFTGFNIGSGNHDSQCDNKACYHFEEVMKLMDKDGETTFLWWVQIPAVKPILGFQHPLGAIPPITAIARAKPYAGNIGFNTDAELNDKNEVWPKRKYLFYWGDPPTAFPPGLALNWNVQWHMSHEAKQEYRVKFVPIFPIRMREDLLILPGLNSAHTGNNRGGRDSGELRAELLGSIAH